MPKAKYPKYMPTTRATFCLVAGFVTEGWRKVRNTGASAKATNSDATKFSCQPQNVFQQ